MCRARPVASSTSTMTTGPVVARFHPRWYKGTDPIPPAPEGDNH